MPQSKEHRSILASNPAIGHSRSTVSMLACTMTSYAIQMTSQSHQNHDVKLHKGLLEQSGHNWDSGLSIQSLQTLTLLTQQLV